MGKTLLWTRNLMLAAAVALLGYCGFVVADSWLFQRRELAAFDTLLPESPEGSEGTQRASHGTPRTTAGGLLGRVDVPRLGISVAVVEGTTDASLRRAAGHIAGTALPGRPGNVGISAHRDTFFRPLRNIRGNDTVTLTTLNGEFRYRVVSTKIVSPDDVTVLKAASKESLTLVTCYPFYFIGPAPNRFVVRAERTL